jgi:hypothetical protein
MLEFRCESVSLLVTVTRTAALAVTVETDVTFQRHSSGWYT